MALDFLIIGAQKAASTFVHECLLDHPDVFIPRDEIGYFEDPYFTRMTPSQFEALFRNAPAQAQVGIKRPDYLGRPECPARIFRHSPQAKLVAVLRAPVDRVVSAYFWYIYQGYIPRVDVNRGLRGILEGKYARDYPKAAEILEYGLYHAHIQRYQEYFDASNLYLLLHEDIQSDSGGEMQKIYIYLGVQPDHLSRAQSRRPKPSIYSLARLGILQLRNPFVYRYHAWDNEMLTLTLRRGILAYGARALFFGLDKLLLQHIWTNAKPVLEPDVLAQLTAYYQDDVLRLQAQLGRDLGHWLDLGKMDKIEPGSATERVMHQNP